MVMPACCGETDNVLEPEEVTVRVRVTDLVCAGVLESVTVKVSEVALALAVGVPLRVPVEGASVSPAGSEPLANVHV